MALTTFQKLGSLELYKKSLNFLFAMIHLTWLGQSTASSQNIYTIFLLFDSVTSPLK